MFGGDPVCGVGLFTCSRERRVEDAVIRKSAFLRSSVILGGGRLLQIASGTLGRRSRTSDPPHAGAGYVRGG
ncbi:hypothetical protein ACTIVE_1664 [Actinomadura verrucosospora]|uniref:Uncharacterized protein n=1 Tax=Actinomadura verrucosospora TaxID=46165 RepID=A0A7D4AJ95_ACTVE|nr:hypothetical protein ACTIVE_1664 [Actinomadura verrucosospora]